MQSVNYFRSNLFPFDQMDKNEVVVCSRAQKNVMSFAHELVHVLKVINLGLGCGTP